jgi:hypothetical protein
MNWQDKIYESLVEGSGGVKSLQRRGAAQAKAGDKAGAARTKTALQYRAGSRKDARDDRLANTEGYRNRHVSPTLKVGAPRVPQKPPAFRKPTDQSKPGYGEETPTRGKERSKTARRALQRGAGGGDKLTGGEDRSHRSMPDDIKHRRKMAMGEPKTAQEVERGAESDTRMRKERAAKRRMGNPQNPRRGSFLSLSQRQDSETQVDWKDKVYNSLTEAKYIGTTAGGTERVYRRKSGAVTRVGKKFVPSKTGKGGTYTGKPERRGTKKPVSKSKKIARAAAREAGDPEAFQRRY